MFLNGNNFYAIKEALRKSRERPKVWEVRNIAFVMLNLFQHPTCHVEKYSLILFLWIPK